MPCVCVWMGGWVRACVHVCLCFMCHVCVCVCVCAGRQSPGVPGLGKVLEVPTLCGTTTTNGNGGVYGTPSISGPTYNNNNNNRRESVYGSGGGTPPATPARPQQSAPLEQLTPAPMGGGAAECVCVCCVYVSVPPYAGPFKAAHTGTMGAGGVPRSERGGGAAECAYGVHVCMVVYVCVCVCVRGIESVCVKLREYVCCVYASVYVPLCACAGWWQEGR